MNPTGYRADALITVGGCDKSVPGALTPLARLNTIGLALYGGAAHPGPPLPSEPSQRGLDPGSVMEGIGKFGKGLLDIEELSHLECEGLPGIGSCSAMFTSCTMACILEALGLSFCRSGLILSISFFVLSHFFFFFFLLRLK